MNKENKPPELELISKYLAGETTPEEAMQLNNSLNDQDSRDEYDKITHLWNQLPPTPAEHVPSAEDEWNKLEKKIKQLEKFKIRKLVLNRLAVAASIIGLILFISYTWIINDEIEQVASNNEQVIIKTETGEVRTDTLPDGSIIIMNMNSSVAYSPGFNNNREMKLSGETYFNVVPSKTKPFIITIDELKIKVVGTSFNVRNISSNNSIEVQVQSGIVKMSAAQKEITVIKGKTGIYYKDDGDLNLNDTLDVNSLSYATKTFSFNDLSLVAACRYLEKAFNVTIKIDANKFEDCRLSAEFNNKPLDYILDIISATLNCNYKNQGNIIYITGEGCK